MTKIHSIAAAILAVACATGAQAQNRTAMDNGMYGEIGYSQVKVTGAGGTGKPDAVRFLIGSELQKGLALEAMYMTTISKDSRVGYDASVSAYGIFLKPKMALTDNTDVFARVGATRANITAATGGSHKGNDLAYGLGIQTNFSKSVYGQFDYMNTYERSGVAAKGYTLSLGTRF
jgi:hypothetical protein